MKLSGLGNPGSQEWTSPISIIGRHATMQCFQFREKLLAGKPCIAAYSFRTATVRLAQSPKGVQKLTVNQDGDRYRVVPIPAHHCSRRESQSSWKEFLAGLRERGLRGVQFVISDDHREC